MTITRIAVPLNSLRGWGGGAGIGRQEGFVNESFGNEENDCGLPSLWSANLVTSRGAEWNYFGHDWIVVSFFRCFFFLF